MVTACTVRDLVGAYIKQIPVTVLFHFDPYVNTYSDWSLVNVEDGAEQQFKGIQRELEQNLPLVLENMPSGQLGQLSHSQPQ